MAVELQAWIDATGVHPLRPTPLPRKILLEQIAPKVLQMERGLEAFLTGDRTMLLYNILDNHQTRSYDQAVGVLDDLAGDAGARRSGRALRRQVEGGLLRGRRRCRPPAGPRQTWGGAPGSSRRAAAAASTSRPRRGRSMG